MAAVSDDGPVLPLTPLEEAQEAELLGEMWKERAEDRFDEAAYWEGDSSW